MLWYNLINISIVITSLCPFKTAEGLDWLKPYPDQTDVGTLISDRFGFDWDTIKLSTYN